MYVYSGSGAVGGTEASSGDTIVLGRNEGGGDGVILESGAEECPRCAWRGSRYGSTHRHGPFVMNTREEIMQAFSWITRTDTRAAQGNDGRFRG